MTKPLAQRIAEEAAAGRLNTTRPPKVPAIPEPSKNLDSLFDAVKAIKTWIDAREARGAASAMDKLLSMRDLYDSGLMAIQGSTLPTSPAVSPAPAPSDDSGFEDPRPVLLTPPTPTDLVALGAFKSVIMSWEMTDYQNHSHVEIWRATTNNLGVATQVGQSTANVYADATGVTGTTYYYWIRAIGVHPESGATITGAYNAASGAGTSATLGQIITGDVTPQAITSALIGLLAVDTAHIADAAIVNAKIANLAVTDAKIANATITNGKIVSLEAGKITAGSLAVGQYIQSSNYSAGSAGFRINADGTASFNSVDVRGAVSGGAYTAANGYAWPAAGAGGGFFLNGSGLLLGNFNGGAGVTGFVAISQDGSFSMGTPGSTQLYLSGGNVYFTGALNGATGTFSGALSAATGTFAGSLSAASGTFAGTLTAAAVNAVDTINIAGAAVTTSATASGSGSAVSTSVTVPSGATYTVMIMAFQTGGYTRVSDSSPAISTSTLSITGGYSATVREVKEETGTDGIWDYSIPPVSVQGAVSLGAGTHTITVTGASGLNKNIIALVTKR